MRCAQLSRVSIYSFFFFSMFVMDGKIGGCLSTTEPSLFLYFWKRIPVKVQLGKILLGKLYFHSSLCSYRLTHRTYMKIQKSIGKTHWTKYVIFTPFYFWNKTKRILKIYYNILPTKYLRPIKSVLRVCCKILQIFNQMINNQFEVCFRWEILYILQLMLLQYMHYEPEIY